MRDNRSRSSHLLLAAGALVAAIAAGCAQTAPASSNAEPAASTADHAAAYAPGLGEIMTLQQMRHTKLWFAGEAGNWELADYEVIELGEGFDDVVTFHPTHEGSPVPLNDAITRIVNVPLGDVRAAVEKRDAKGFEAAYDALTAACNDCHQATNFGFNRVQRPAANPYPDQVFAPVR